MFQNYLKIAWRNLLKNKVTGIINIVGLAIGMAVAIMIGLWLNDELTYDRSHANYDRIVRVMLRQSFNGEIMAGNAVSIPTASTIRNEFGDDFKHVCLASWNFENLLANGDQRFLREGMYVEPGFLETFSVSMLNGSHQDCFTTPYSIIINRSTATSLFGDQDPMGKTIRFNNEHDLEVTGVFEDFPRNSSLYTSHFFSTWDFYKASQDWVRESESNWGNHSFQMLAQLADKADEETTSLKIRDIEKVHNEVGNPEYFLFPMRKWHLYSEFREGINVGGRIQFVWLFGIIGVFVLLIACINFMNLSTARSEQRSKEVGIRKTIGSMREQLIGQFLTESLLVTLIALVLSILLVASSLSWFNELAGKEMSLPLTQPLFWLMMLGFTGLTGFLAGSYPAFYLSSFQPLEAIKGTLKFGRFASLPRKILVTVQFTISVALIIGTLVVYQQIQHAKNRPVGYDRSQLISFMDNTELYTKREALRTELLKTGHVEEVAYSSGPITQVWSNQSDYNWEGQDPNMTPVFATSACSPEFGKTIGWEILEGRDFSRDRGTDTSALILNEAAVELIGLPDMVGRTIRYNETPFHVIGIIKNMVMESPYHPIKPTIFRLDKDWVAVHTARLKTGVPIKTALASVEYVFKQLAPSTPFDYSFVDESYDRKFRSEERIARLAKVFAILAILISCLGLFGLSAFVAERRTKEIGIRKVLGATVTHLWALQSKGFLGLVLLSSFIATPLAWYFLSSWLEGYEYRVTLNWQVFILAAILAIVVTLATVSYQSIRAALANPINSLKNE